MLKIKRKFPKHKMSFHRMEISWSSGIILPLPVGERRTDGSKGTLLIDFKNRAYLSTQLFKLMRIEGLGTVAQGAKTAKGLFFGLVQILEEGPHYHLPELRDRGASCLITVILMVEANFLCVSIYMSFSNDMFDRDFSIRRPVTNRYSMLDVSV